MYLSLFIEIFQSAVLKRPNDIESICSLPILWASRAATENSRPLMNFQGKELDVVRSISF